MASRRPGRGDCRVRVARSSRLRVSTDVSALLPGRGDAAALSAWTRAFGGAEPAFVLVRGAHAADVAAVAEGLVEALGRAPSIQRVLDHVPTPALPGDPTLAWAFAGPEARARSPPWSPPPGCVRACPETRELLLAPAADTDVQAWLARNPLRLAQVPWDHPRSCSRAWATRRGASSSPTRDARAWWWCSREARPWSRLRRARWWRTSSGPSDRWPARASRWSSPEGTPSPSRPSRCSAAISS